ncbi:MAG: hypothetical protein QXV61_01870 [Archaeoglobaceae archaeon]
MGRSIPSVRLEVKEIAERWLRTARVMKKEEKIYAERLAEMAKRHSSEAFYSFDDPLEAAIFSVLVEILRKIDELKKENVDPGLLFEKGQDFSLVKGQKD